MFRLGAIWAQTDVGIIGRNGDMPWYAPEDLAHFKKVTLGAPVIMGRRTWESFPPRFRPLPGRTNIVISRSVTEAEERDGALWVPSLDAALYAARDAAGAPVEATPADTAAVDAWIIGGGSVYAEALSRTDLPTFDPPKPCIPRSWLPSTRAITTRWIPRASSTCGVCRIRFRHCGSRAS